LNREARVKQISRHLAAGLSAAALCAWPCLAQPWEFQITPYAWLSGIDGNLGTVPVPDIPPERVSLSFGDILDDLDYAGMLYASARRGPWVVLLDATTAKTTSDEPGGGVVVEKVTIESTTSNLALAVGRTVASAPDYRVDVYAGGRAWWLKNEFTVRTVPGTEPGPIEADSDANWIDPIIGVAANRKVAERWELFGSAEIGGFGVGAENEWSLLVGANYVVNDLFAVTGGWRVLSVDYDDDGIVYDVDQSGPLIGATFRF
jgi:hypothetical protein